MISRRYTSALESLRQTTVKPSKKSVPLEYFQWERLIVDECHEPLCMSAEEVKERAESWPNHGRLIAPSVSWSLLAPRRISPVQALERAAISANRSSCAVRELLGLGLADTSARPLRARKAIWGLTGTPLLSSEVRAPMCHHARGV